jgi:predicted transcriptional regulator
MVRYQKWRSYTRREIRYILMKVLKENRYGISISDISRTLKMDRGLVGEEIRNLSEMNKIKVRKVGTSKLVYRRWFYHG